MARIPYRCKPVSPQILLNAIDALLSAPQHKLSPASMKDPDDSTDNAWLQTMTTLLRATAVWLISEGDESGSWNFHVITTKLCLDEMSEVVKASKAHGLTERLKNGLPHVRSLLTALKDRERANASDSASAALARLLNY